MTIENNSTSAAAKTTGPVAAKLASYTPLQYSVEVADIEAQIWEVEGIRVIIRAASTRRVPGFGYNYSNALRSGTVGDLIARLKTVFKPAGDVSEWIIVDGDGRAKFPNTWKLAKIRATYGKDVAE